MGYKILQNWNTHGLLMGFGFHTQLGIIKHRLANPPILYMGMAE
jgi:hypothetical protein